MEYIENVIDSFRHGACLIGALEHAPRMLVGCRNRRTHRESHRLRSCEYSLLNEVTPIGDILKELTFPYFHFPENLSVTFNMLKQVFMGRFSIRVALTSF